MVAPRAARAPREPRVVVVGGGFGGLAAVLGLPRARRATLLASTRWFEFLPNIHELLSGVKTPELLRLPLDRIVRDAGHAFQRETVVAIDPEARELQTARGRRRRYEVLVLAVGGIDATHGVAGVEAHGLAFKSVDQCARIGARLAALDRRRTHAEVVIVGGGIEGVEALGEILRRYRSAERFSVTLVDAGERLLAEAPSALDRAIRRLSAPYDVRFLTGTRVARVEADAVVLESGERLPSAATIWTGGPQAPELLAEAGLAPRPGAWAPVDAYLQSTVHPDVFVVGDAAELSEPLPKQGYHALDMGALVAENLQRRIDGRPLRRFEPSAKPMLVSFGDLAGFLVWGGRVVEGPSLAAAKEGVFELVMAQLDRQGWLRALPRAGARTQRALRHLLLPALASPRELGRWARLRLLRAS